MKTFVIIATKREARGAVTLEIEARVTVPATSLSAAYKTARSIPELKHAYLRPE